MDLVLDAADKFVLTPYVYPPEWAEDDWVRQTISLSFIVTSGGFMLYYFFGIMNYVILFDKQYMKHPKFLKNQISKEMWCASTSMPVMTMLTLPFFVGEVRGYSRLYDNIDEYGTGYFVFSLLAFLMFNDCLIYWIHRWLHSRYFYRYIHKEHHRWLVPSPFASHAFHPLDGFSQSLPYHIFVFIFPLHKITYIGLFVLVNFWTISIHDGYFAVPTWAREIVNGAAHHTDHHLYYNYNYGQYFTLWDRIGGSFRSPSPFEGKGPLDDLKRVGKYVEQ